MSPEQQRIEGDMPPPGGVPPGTICDWCARKATNKHANLKKVGHSTVASGTYLYACTVHEALALEVAASVGAR